jgi:hypothetical protein
MQAKFEILLTEKSGIEDSMFILVNEQPNIVISPSNHAGWREVLFGIHSSFDEKPLLKDAEEYMVEELSFRQNNNMRDWRWHKVHTDQSGMRFFSTNIRNTQEEEE